MTDTLMKKGAVLALESDAEIRVLAGLVAVAHAEGGVFVPQGDDMYFLRFDEEFVTAVASLEEAMQAIYPSDADGES